MRVLRDERRKEPLVVNLKSRESTFLGFTEDVVQGIKGSRHFGGQGITRGRHWTRNHRKERRR